MSRLLIDEEPLIVIPTLAAAIGLNRAVFLQQLNYWIKKAGHVRENRRWIYNTYQEWHEQFPFWTPEAIKKIVLQLEQRGFIETTDRFNKIPTDRTKWYTINYARVESLENTEGAKSNARDSEGAKSNARIEGAKSNALTRDYQESTPTGDAGASSRAKTDPGGYFADLLKIAGQSPTDREKERCFPHLRQLVTKKGATRQEMEVIIGKAYEAHMGGFDWWPHDMLTKLRNGNVRHIDSAPKGQERPNKRELK